MIGERVRLARDYTGLSQARLANQMAVSQSTVAYIERERFVPSDALLRKIAGTTGFPLPFFHKGDLDPFPLGSLLFRARAKVPMAMRQDAHAKARLTWELARYLLGRVKEWPVRLPQCPGIPVAQAADAVRIGLGLPSQDPVTSFVPALERAGVLVTAILTAGTGLDGFCLWAGANGQRPVMVLDSATPGDRMRWSAAHELGHLVLHRTVRGGGDAAEREADAFAAQFLLPENAIRRELVAPVTLTGLAALKARWRVSIQALVRRARDLEIITDRQYRYVFEQIGKQGWRTKEPIDVPREQPQALAQLIQAVYGSADNLRLPLTEAGLPLSLLQSVAWPTLAPVPAERPKVIALHAGHHTDR